MFAAEIYNNDVLAAFCGLLSPTRYFIESLAVAESRCLPVSARHVEPCCLIINFRLYTKQTAAGCT